MRILRQKIPRDDGWTFVEATLSVVIMAIMVLGLTIVMMAFREHLDRSWAIRVMDQYGNDVVERLTHELRNALDVRIFNGPGDTHQLEVKYLDPSTLKETYTTLWTADHKNVQIKINNVSLDRTFPPRNPGRGESYQIVEFRLVGYGADTKNLFEIEDSKRRKDIFLEATYEIVFTLRYNRQAINPGEHNWKYEKTYRNRVYVRNKNLVVKQGVTE